MHALAWVALTCSFVAYLIALQVGPSCADAVAPWAMVAFICSFSLVAFLQERKKGGRR